MRGIIISFGFMNDAESADRNSLHKTAVLYTQDLSTFILLQ